jgi:hypothetical protein
MESNAEELIKKTYNEEEQYLCKYIIIQIIVLMIGSL